MLDIKFIRENPTLVRDAARKKHINFDTEALLRVDAERRAKITEVEAMRAELNAVSDAVPKITNEADKKKAIEGMREFKKKLAEKEAELAAIEEKFKTLMYQVPNIPDPSVPDGASDADNVEVRQWGVHPEFSFEPKDHITLMQELDLADFERGVKVAGFRGYILKREAALLEVAVWQYALVHLAGKGYVPLAVPSFVREENLVGTGYLPQAKDEIYKTQEEYLAGTGEVATMGMHVGEILEISDLPKKYAAISPCYRREIGSYGKDTKGLYRVHEFMKVEQVVLCPADHSTSVELHEEITKNSEELLQALGLHYRVVLNAGGDLGLGQVKKYDIETWIPSQGRYGETHSASYFHDFQTRRLNIRYRDVDGVIRFAHSLNNTGIATPRILISLLEQNQREDGSIAIPEVLQSFMGGIKEIRRS
jgi:seryl-tRNA synthetase